MTGLTFWSIAYIGFAGTIGAMAGVVAVLFIIGFFGAMFK